MSITKITVENFKRIEKNTITLPSHVVLAGPNNAGKTTLLQAIAAWSLSLREWRKLNDFQRHGGAYTKAPIARQAFSAVPLQNFELLWSNCHKNLPIKIEVEGEDWKAPIEIISDSTEQIYARPLVGASRNFLQKPPLDIVFIPAMTGLSHAEPVYQKEKIDQLLGMGKPGEVLRNLLLEASQKSEVWEKILEAMRIIFHCELLPPRGNADIYAGYRECKKDAPDLEIASAGSGFLQVLMLLTFLHSRPGAILLLDEPDAHLYMLLQDYVYHELKRAAVESKAQLIMATHSEVIINAAKDENLKIVIDGAIIEQEQGARKIANVMRMLTNTDILRAKTSPGILYVDDYTDLDILREWAKTLKHPAAKVLQEPLFWRSRVNEHHAGAVGISADKHYQALRTVHPSICGVHLLDGDNKEIQESDDDHFARIRWRRYEIENYLWHPAALSRFVKKTAGTQQAVEDMNAYCRSQFPPVMFTDPLGDIDYLVNTKASTMLSSVLQSAGIHGFPKSHFYEIAREMKASEIHPEVKEKLDTIAEKIAPQNNG